MKGSYHFRVKSKKTMFVFSIRRNITVIKGDSATGKTTLLHMLYEYLRVGRESGFSVTTDAAYSVYLRPEVGRDWRDALLPLKNTVIFIEENNPFVFSEEFADFVKNSGNYFVLVNRAPFKMLPYSIHEVYEIVTTGAHVNVKESYHELRELYSNFPFPEKKKIQTILTEDGNAGYQFFASVLKNGAVKSANGNGNIIYEMKKNGNRDMLVIADGAAFGAMMEDCLEFLEQCTSRRIWMWLPESFEYLLLQADVVQSEELAAILESPSEYVESERFESWEQFFTDLLVRLTADTDHRYSKSHLHTYYLRTKIVKKVLAQFPEKQLIEDLE